LAGAFVYIVLGLRIKKASGGMGWNGRAGWRFAYRLWGEDHRHVMVWHSMARTEPCLGSLGRKAGVGAQRIE
jgi:hypothetical protein